MEQIFVFIAFAALVIVLIVVGQMMAAKRRKALGEWAASKGLQFSPAKDYGMEDRFGKFKCLGQGSRRYAYNVISGDWQGRALTAFDYHYETYSHDSKGHRRTNHHHLSAVILTVDLPLKALFIRPESFLDSITEFMGFDDIDFESAEFSRTFFVKAESKRWAYDVIHPRTMELLLQHPRMSIQLDRRSMIACRSDTFSPAEFETAIGLIDGVLDGFPPYLVQQLQEGA